MGNPEQKTQGLEPLKPAAPDEIGSRYEILAELGRGGMGIVYKARDRETGELVGLKVLKPEVSEDPSAMERFKDELRLARKITHKNVCRIHEFSRAGQTAYISMELLEGQTLRTRLNQGRRLPCQEALAIAQQIGAGLGEAHRQGVVHRDLKPENVMIDAAGGVKLMDFGIARPFGTGTLATGAIVGTPAYMAPEQVEGSGVGARADIYALGLILYEMLTGVQVFSGDSAITVALKQIRETPRPPREIEPSLPESVQQTILKCLEKDAARRFQTVQELTAALEQPPTVAPRRVTSRVRLGVAAVATAVLLAAVTVLGLIQRARKAGPGAPPRAAAARFLPPIPLSCRFDLKRGRLIVSAGDKVVFRQLLQGQKRGGFMGVGGRYEGRILGTLTLPADALELTIRVVSSENKTDHVETIAVTTDPPSTLHITANHEALTARWVPQ